MDAILRTLGRTEGSITARVAQLERLAYPTSEAGRAAIMTDINGILRDAQQRSMTLFDKTPRRRSGATVPEVPSQRRRELHAGA